MASERATSDRTADELTRRRAIGAVLENALACLAPEYRAVFLLREAHGLGYDELSRVLGIELGTVKSRLSRARSALRKALEEAGHV